MPKTGKRTRYVDRSTKTVCLDVARGVPPSPSAPAKLKWYIQVRRDACPALFLAHAHVLLVALVPCLLALAARAPCPFVHTLALVLAHAPVLLVALAPCLLALAARAPCPFVHTLALALAIM
jgi:hypothetical protein